LLIDQELDLADTQVRSQKEVPEVFLFGIVAKVPDVDSVVALGCLSLGGVGLVAARSNSFRGCVGSLVAEA